MDDETLHARVKVKFFHLRDYLPNPLQFPALLLGIAGVRRVEDALIGKAFEIPLRTASVLRYPLMNGKNLKQVSSLKSECILRLYLRCFGNDL